MASPAASSPTARSKQRKVQLTLDLDHVNGEEPIDPASDEWSVGFVITYLTFFFAGASTISMWSALTLCLDFFTQKYPSDRVGFVFPVVNMSSLLVISLFMVLAGRQLPLQPRMHGGLCAYLFFIVVLPLINIADVHAPIAYALTIISLIGSTISSSVLQSTIYGLAGVFGPLFTQAIDGGKGFGAMLLFIVRLIVKWYFLAPLSMQATDTGHQVHEAKISMAVFFGVAFSIVVISWGLYATMTRIDYAQPLMKEYSLVQNQTPFASPIFSPTATPMTGSPRKTFAFPTTTLTERSPLIRRSSMERDTDASMIERGSRQDSITPAGDGSDDMDDEQLGQEHASSAMVLTVLRTAAKPFFTLFLSFFVCLSCFPGLISAIPSTTLHMSDWFPIILVGCYNLGDLIGKNLPVRVMYFDVTTLHLPWLLQLAFIPFFLATLVAPFSDVLTIVVTLSLGLVTGYVATSAMILAPAMCSEYQREVAGMIASLCSIVGLCAGSYNGLALETIVQLWEQGRVSS